MKRLAALFFSLFMIVSMMLFPGCAASGDVSRVSAALDGLTSSKARHEHQVQKAVLYPIEGISVSKKMKQYDFDVIVNGDECSMVTEFRGRTDDTGVADDGSSEADLQKQYVKDGMAYCSSGEPGRYTKQALTKKVISGIQTLSCIPAVKYQAFPRGRTQITIGGISREVDVFEASMPVDLVDQLFYGQAFASVDGLLRDLGSEQDGLFVQIESSDYQKLDSCSCRIYLDGAAIVRFEYNMQIAVDLSKVLMYPIQPHGWAKATFSTVVEVLETANDIQIDFPEFTSNNTELIEVPPSESPTSLDMFHPSMKPAP
jgi:hypothetical protein